MSHTKIPTRTEHICPVFGHACKLPDSVLPTYTDIMKHCNYIKQMIKSEETKELTVNEIAEIIASDVQTIWQRSLSQVFHVPE